jgi:hypothetical protein
MPAAMLTSKGKLVAPNVLRTAQFEIPGIIY